MTLTRSKKIFLFYLIIYSVYLIFLTLSPFRFRPPQWHHFPWPIGPSRFEWFDFVANIFLFLPFGFLMTPLFHQPGSTWKAIIISAAASLTIESLQIITVGRYPAFGDIFTNAMGGGVGFLTGKWFEQRRDVADPDQHQLHSNIRNFFVGIFIVYSCFLLHLSSLPSELFPHRNGSINILLGNNIEKDRPWKGEIISLAIYDKALAPDAIKRHYQNAEETKQNRLALYSLPNHPAYLENEIAQQIYLTQQMTVEAWVRPQRQLDAGGRLFAFVMADHSLFYIDQEIDEIIIGVRHSLLKRFRLHSEGVDETSLSTTIDSPTHLVAVYRPEKMEIYLNGKNIGEGFFTSQFFLLANYLNLDRMPFGGRGFLGLLVFWPFGLFLSLAFKKPSMELIPHTLFGFLFIALILFMQGQNPYPFFTERTVWAPFLASALGVASGERMKRHLSTPSLGQP